MVSVENIFGRLFEAFSSGEMHTRVTGLCEISPFLQKFYNISLHEDNISAFKNVFFWVNYFPSGVLHTWLIWGKPFWPH
jgi:hypothetical protein